jgi:saccharopine dehydrogenase-like NADP-dependent oxidoreductase
MKEKTLRYPGHIEKMKILRETGFFSHESLDIHGKQVRPIDVTARLLFPVWKLREGERDITVMKVVVEGIKDGKKTRYTYDLLDAYDPATQVHSMARTTGYTATVALRMIAGGIYAHHGITVPEYLGRRTECVNYLLAGLKERGVNYRETVGGPDD